MELSRVEALNLCKKWLDESVRVRLIFESPIVSGRFTGILARVIDSPDGKESLGLASEDLSDDEIPASIASISLILATSFALTDPRDAGPGREILEGEMDIGLFIGFLSGERCILYELPNQT